MKAIQTNAMLASTLVPKERYRLKGEMSLLNVRSVTLAVGATADRVKDMRKKNVKGRSMKFWVGIEYKLIRF